MSLSHVHGHDFRGVLRVVLLSDLGPPVCMSKMNSPGRPCSWATLDVYRKRSKHCNQGYMLRTEYNVRNTSNGKR